VIDATQRELLGLLLGCAARTSASFTQALAAADRATGRKDARTLTRELLSDLAIRDWIELCRERPGGTEAPIPRLHYELELAAARNWDEQSGEPRVRYALTEKGRGQLGAMSSTQQRRG
jgi:hypothetical protein